MCTAYEKRCNCGGRTASFHFKDNIIPEQAIKGIYCPGCSSDIHVNHDSMVIDNGWIIEYDMDMVNFMAHKISHHGSITPGFLFDEGYCTWNGIYPGDHIDSVKERESVVALAKSNPVLYLKKMKSWAEERIERLQEEGWRKAASGYKG